MIELSHHRGCLLSRAFHDACKVCVCVSLCPSRRGFLVDRLVKASLLRVVGGRVPREGELDEFVVDKVSDEVLVIIRIFPATTAGATCAM